MWRRFLSPLERGCYSQYQSYHKSGSQCHNHRVRSWPQHNCPLISPMPFRVDLCLGCLEHIIHKGFSCLRMCWWHDDLGVSKGDLVINKPCLTDFFSLSTWGQIRTNWGLSLAWHTIRTQPWALICMSQEPDAALSRSGLTIRDCS